MFAITNCDYLPPITLRSKGFGDAFKLAAASVDPNKSLHVLITIKR